MSLPIVLRKEAQQEFDEAFDWYDEKQPGLALGFTSEVEKVFDRIATHPKCTQSCSPTSARRWFGDFLTAFSTAHIRTASKSSRYFTANEIRPFGKSEPK